MTIISLLIGFGAPGRGQSQMSTLCHEPLRPQFYFFARQFSDYRLNPVEHQEGWIDDLNGLIYYDGEYRPTSASRWYSSRVDNLSGGSTVRSGTAMPHIRDHQNSRLRIERDAGDGQALGDISDEVRRAYLCRVNVRIED